MSVYHTAKSDGILLQGRDIERFEIGNSVAFQHDILNGLPKEFEQCDVLYTEPPWPAGNVAFNKRAGIDNSFADLMKATSDIIQKDNRPIFMAVCKAHLKSLPEPDYIKKYTFNKNEGLLASWNAKPPIANLNLALLNMLANEYDCIGDFMCGYGVAPLIFHSAGKRFVATDYVKHCIGVLEARVLPHENLSQPERL